MRKWLALGLILLFGCTIDPGEAYFAAA